MDGAEQRSHPAIGTIGGSILARLDSEMVGAVKRGIPAWYILCMTRLGVDIVQTGDSS